MRKQLQKKIQSKNGFTLVELIVVLVIMGILTAALVPTVTGYVGDAKVKVSESNERMVEQAALLYLTDYEIAGNTGAPSELTVQDLVDAGYLSGTDAALTGYEISYTAGENGKYSIAINAPESNV